MNIQKMRSMRMAHVVLAIALSIFISFLLQHRAGAVTYYGPEDTNVRYVLEHSDTTRATTLTVPIYYRTDPGTVAVYAGDFLRNTGAGTDIRVSFNGGPEISSDTSFLVGGFTYDPTSGWYKSTVTASMRNYSGTGWRNYIHFRFELINRAGYIGYGGGTFQQASKGYYSTSPASSYSLYLATPCTVTSNQYQTLALYDLDHRNADNGGYSIYVNVYDETTGQHIAAYDGNRDGGMGQGGTLNIPVTFQPRHKYRVDIINVSPNNVIQYNFPFDNIAYTIGCQWNLEGSSSVNGSAGPINATVGNRLNWGHQIVNRGPHPTDRTVYSNLGMSGFSNGWGTGLSDSPIGGGAGVGVIRSAWSYNVYDVTQNDVGRSLCQWVQFDPVNSSGARDGRGNQACANIPYNYTLNPSVTVPQTEVEVGGTMTVSAKVDNSGPTKSKPTNWQISYVTLPSGAAIPGAANSPSAPCVFYSGGGRTCTAGSFTAGGAGSGSDVFMPPSYNFPARTAEVGDLSVGTQICYVLSVKDRSSSSSEWRHSAPDCAVVSKRPVVRVLGGDALVGRGTAIGSIISTNVKNTGGKKYGSWAEYGLVSSGLVSGMASASGYAGGVTAGSLCGVSYLTFSNKVGTNSCSDARIGQYTFKAASSTIASRFPVTSATQISGNQAIGSMTGGTTYTSNAAGSDINLTATPSTRVDAGKWVVINAPNATVKIMNNIIYTDAALTSVSQIPQMVIIARNIIIADSVGQVDAWLFATGTGVNGRVNTCGAGGVTEATTLTSEVCKDKLTVNGPVMANHLVLRRTAGAGTNTSSGDPSEVFNLRPDAYLWASNLQAGTTKAQTVMTTELPPRY